MRVFDRQDKRQRDQVSHALDLCLSNATSGYVSLAISSIRRSYSLMRSFSDSTSRNSGSRPRTFVVSNDGETVTDQFAGWKASWRRLTKGPPGSHALSGSWQSLKMESTSDKNPLITYKLEGSTITMSRPTGQSYRAPLDGKDAPYEGDPNVIAVSVKRIDANTIEETYKFDGKAPTVARVSVSADGDSMTMTVKDLDLAQRLNSPPLDSSVAKLNRVASSPASFPYMLSGVSVSALAARNPIPIQSVNAK
jgi:hypothetical protein